MVKLQSILFLSLATTALAAPAWWEQWSLTKARDTVVAHFPSSKDDSLRLVQTAADKAPEWMNEAQRLELLRKSVSYMDITDHQDLGDHIGILGKSALPKEAVHQKQVAKYVDQLSTANMEVALTALSTQFKTRYYKSESGKEASKWLYTQISNLIEETEAASDVSIRKFQHEKWDQISIIARFEGTDPSLSNEPVIVGSHLDSVNAWLPAWGTSPGADDDGSGSVTILEVFRALVNKGFRPARPVEFHWYSAEEAGLLGSQDVARSYEKKGVNVLAMIQNDMTGYKSERFPEAYGVVNDYVDEELTELVRVYARAYGDIPVIETTCGYGCSDHASWTKAGYRSAFAIEGEFSDISPYIHGSDDTVAHVDFDHMKQFAKLSLGFAVELGFYKGEK